MHNRAAIVRSGEVEVLPQEQSKDQLQYSLWLRFCYIIVLSMIIL
jgi:hypothetical protein